MILFHVTNDVFVVIELCLDEVVVVLDYLKLFLFVFEDANDIDNLVRGFDHKFEVLLRKRKRIGLVDDLPEGSLQSRDPFPVEIEIYFYLFIFYLLIFHF